MHKEASEWTQIQMEHACHGALAFGKDKPVRFGWIGL